MQLPNLRARGKSITPRALRASASRRCIVCQVLQAIFYGIEGLSPDAGNEPKFEMQERMRTMRWSSEEGSLSWTAGDGQIWRFDIFKLQEHDPRDLLNGHPFLVTCSYPSSNTANDVAMERLLTWLTKCEAEHSSCQHTKTVPPSRLIKVSDNGELPRVIETGRRNQEDKDLSYVCLSHRWGASTRNSSLYTSNKSNYMTGIPLDALPRLFKDVFHVVRKLGYSYVWIDSLCIIQDSEEDWAHEAALMSTIYENAIITIAATWCSDSAQGLFSQLDSLRGTKIAVLGGEGVFLRPKPAHPLAGPGDAMTASWTENYPLLGRGWVFQEHTLSRRFVHFTKDEIVFECLESVWCECRSNEKRWRTRRRQQETGKGELRTHKWMYLVHDFKMLSLTYDKDLLPAMAGIAKAFARHHGGTYLAGLWQEDLPTQIMWAPGVLNGDLHPRPVNRIVPTWSWASVLNPVFWNREKRDCNLLEILECTPGGDRRDYALRHGA
jgi:hypothetical protein